MTSAAQHREVDQNYDFFQRNLAKFLTGHRNQYALLKEQEVVEFFDRPIDALAKAQDMFPDGIFSIQEVTDEPIDLGFFSHVGH